jgi:hypothetical protein
MRCVRVWSSSIQGVPVLIKGVLATNPLARATRDYGCAERRSISSIGL